LTPFFAQPPSLSVYPFFFWLTLFYLTDLIEASVVVHTVIVALGRLTEKEGEGEREREGGREGGRKEGRMEGREGGRKY
jgi:hypothetical protein